MTSPVGDDVEEAARAIVEPIIDGLFMRDPVDWIDLLIWHRQVHLRVTQMLTREQGYPLAQLRKRNLSQAQIAALLGDVGIGMSDSRVGQLVAGVAGDQPE